MLLLGTNWKTHWEFGKYLGNVIGNLLEHGGNNTIQK
jgi:hypothetical protein